MHREGCSDKGKGPGACPACRRTRRLPGTGSALILAKASSPQRPCAPVTPLRSFPAPCTQGWSQWPCEASPAPPTSCRNSTASRPSSSSVFTRDILTQVRKPPENFQPEYALSQACMKPTLSGLGGQRRKVHVNQAGFERGQTPTPAPTSSRFLCRYHQDAPTAHSPLPQRPAFWLPDGGGAVSCLRARALSLRLPAGEALPTPTPASQHLLPGQPAPCSADVPPAPQGTLGFSSPGGALTGPQRREEASPGSSQPGRTPQHPPRTAIITRAQASGNRMAGLRTHARGAERGWAGRGHSQLQAGKGEGSLGGRRCRGGGPGLQDGQDWGAGV